MSKQGVLLENMAAPGYFRVHEDNTAALPRISDPNKQALVGYYHATGRVVKNGGIRATPLFTDKDIIAVKSGSGRGLTFLPDTLVVPLTLGEIAAATRCGIALEQMNLPGFFMTHSENRVEPPPGIMLTMGIARGMYYAVRVYQAGVVCHPIGKKSESTRAILAECSFLFNAGMLVIPVSVKDAATASGWNPADFPQL